MRLTCSWLRDPREAAAVQLLASAAQSKPGPRCGKGKVRENTKTLQYACLPCTNASGCRGNKPSSMPAMGCKAEHMVVCVVEQMTARQWVRLDSWLNALLSHQSDVLNEVINIDSSANNDHGVYGCMTC